MTAKIDPETQHELAAQARLTRLARYRTMQLGLERERRQQIARHRLLALHRNGSWGWLAL